MKQELINQLRTKYPSILSKPITMECRDGWYSLLDHLFGVLEGQAKYPDANIFDEMYVSQLKEKFGTLRCYMSLHDPTMEGAISLAESLSATICEVCGSHHGQLYSIGNWMQTLCPDDYNRLQIEWQNKQDELKGSK